MRLATRVSLGIVALAAFAGLAIWMTTMHGVLHPFGRQCIGWKSAGEIDVLEAVDDVAKRYQIDRDRIALAGFSMGGAGAWHIGAHYTDRFAVIHAGAGFAETARYNRLKPQDYPPGYEQVLWGVYDTPGYVRNLLNLPVIAYSGENDKQIQAARVMEAAFAAEGRELPHVIGAKMGHKYDDRSRQLITDFVGRGLADGRDLSNQEIHLQTRTLRYHRMHWVAAHGLIEHWKDSRIDATRNGAAVSVKTKNIREFSVESGEPPLQSATVDGVHIAIPGEPGRVRFHLAGERWQLGELPGAERRKVPGLQGPIDDAFLDSFLVVLPSGKSMNPRVQQWIESELSHFEARWRATFRGRLRKKRADEVTAQDMNDYHLVAFGDPGCNPIITRAVQAWGDLDWDKEILRFAGRALAAGEHVPVLIRPNPANRSKYLVINSGPTFREAHDRTNSLQNPKLPDWALIDLKVAPDGQAPGGIVGAGFFDEEWKLK